MLIPAGVEVLNLTVRCKNDLVHGTIEAMGRNGYRMRDTYYSQELPGYSVIEFVQKDA